MFAFDSYRIITTWLLRATDSLPYRVPSGSFRMGARVLLILACVLATTSAQNCASDLKRTPMDIVFVVDSSDASQVPGGNNWETNVKNFIKQTSLLFQIGPINSHVAVVQYTQPNKTSTIYLNEYMSQADLEAAVDRLVIYYKGTASIQDAIMTLNSDTLKTINGKRREVRELVLVLTYSEVFVPQIEGEPTDAFTELLVLDTATMITWRELNDGARGAMYAIDVNGFSNGSIIDHLSNDNRDNVITINSLNDLSNIQSQISTKVCSLLQKEPCPTQVDIALVIDTSESIIANGDQWPLVKSFLKQFISQLDIGFDKVRVGAISYSSTAQIAFNLDAYSTIAQVNAAIDSITFLNGQTNTADALRLLGKLLRPSAFGARVGVPSIGILFTDGQSNIKTGLLAGAALDIRRAGIRMIAVGVGASVEISELAIIASDNSMVVTAPSFAILNDRIARVTSAACDNVQYPPVLGCMDEVDVMFILDSSSSITYQDDENWDLLVKGFAKTLMTIFNIAPDAVRVGVTKFSSDANVEFYLDEHTSNEAVSAAVDGIITEGGQTNIARAFDVAREALVVSRGWRGDKEKTITFLITDGQANEGVDNTLISSLRYQFFKSDQELFFSIGISDDVNLKELRTFTNHENIFLATDFDKTYQLLDTIIERICEEPLVSTTSTTSTTTTTTTTTTTSTTTATTPTITTTTTSTTTARPLTTTITLKPNEGCTGIADVVFVIDVSGSIEQKNFNNIVLFLQDVVKELDVDNGKIRVGVMTFSDDMKVEFNLNTHLTNSRLAAAVDDLEYIRGSTNTAAALQQLPRMFSTANGGRVGTKIGIILTDGESNSRTDTITAARAAKQDGVHLVSLGIGDWLDMHELYAMASYPVSRNMLTVENFNALGTVVTAIKNAVCDNVDECQNNPCRNGGTCNNEVQYYYCQCLTGYGGKNCENECREANVDVVFALDASSSMDLSMFRQQLDFVSDAILSMDVDHSTSTGTRVGLVTYADSVTLNFGLDNNFTKKQLLEALNVMYTGGSTQTAQVLNLVCNQMFQSSGDRSGSKNILALMTDGKSSSRTAVWEEASNCRDLGVTIVTVGIGQGVSQAELRGIASDPVSKNILLAPSFQGLGSVSQRLTQAICNTVDECSPNPCENGGNCNDLINNFECDCTGDWMGKTCNRQCTNNALDIVIVLDASGSVRQEKYPLVKDFVESVMRSYSWSARETHFAVVYFSDESFVQSHFSDSRNMQDAILNMRNTPYLAGKTHTASALGRLTSEMFTPANGARNFASKVAILVTDGGSNINEERTLIAAAKCRTNSIQMIVVPLGRTFANMAEIEGMASDPIDFNVLPVDNFEGLPSIVDDVVMAACEQMDECASGPCRNGGTCKNMMHMYFCECPTGYAGVNCERQCQGGSQLDIALVLDLSGSTNQETLITKAFANSLVMGLDMSQDKTRLALITFADNARVHFNLKEHLNDNLSVLNGMRIMFAGGKTNAQEALNFASTLVLNGANGDRTGVDNVLIFVSDGYSNRVTAGSVSAEVASLRQKGIRAYAIAIGMNPNLRELNEIATDPDNTHVFRIETEADVDDALDSLFAELCI